MIISTDVLHCIVCSEEYGGFTTGSSGWIWCWSSHRSAQQKRWAALPEEADGDAVSIRHASQSNRLQVGRHKPDWNKSDWMTCETGFSSWNVNSNPLIMGRKHTVCIYMTKQNDDVLRVVTVVVVCRLCSGLWLCCCGRWWLDLSCYQPWISLLTLWVGQDSCLSLRSFNNE